MKHSHVGAAQNADDSPKVQLPQAVVSLVLQHVPQRDRLAACARVSRSWAAASAAATTAVDAVLRGKQPCNSLIKWLQKHGQQLGSLKAKQPASDPHPDSGIPVCFRRGNMVIPGGQLSQLCSLSLEGFWLHLDPADGVGQTRSSAGFFAAAYDSEYAERFLWHDTDPDDESDSDHQPYQIIDNRPPPPPPANASSIAAAAAAAAAAQPVLPQLQELHLSRCQPTLVTFTLLITLTNLTKLQLDDVDYREAVSRHPWPEPDGTFSNNILPQMLQQLTLLQDLQLTYSCLDNPRLQHDAFNGLSLLRRLQRLRLTVPRAVDRSVWGRLPPSLTALELRGDAGGGSGFPDLRKESSFLQGLTGLQHLWVRSILVPPARLTTLAAALTYLHIDNVVGEPRSDGPQLMSAVKDLTGLRQSEVANNFQKTPWPRQLFAALTGAKSLTALHIWDLRAQPLPHGVLQHILQANKGLPELQVLRICSDISSYFEESLAQTFSGDIPPWCIDSGDISMIGRLCPGLRHLELQHVVKRSASTDGLSSLPGSLRTLIVAGAAFDSAAAEAVAQLAGLQCLEWSDSPLTDAGLQQLTALTGLTRLRVLRCPNLTLKVAPIAQWQEWQPWPREYPSTGALQDSGQAGSPAVWRPLQQLFADSQSGPGGGDEGEGSSKGHKVPKGLGAGRGSREREGSGCSRRKATK